MLVLAGALATGAAAASSADPGITGTTILLGGTSPLSGTASAYASVARGAGAYFKYVNANGGVNGRTITYKVLDDASNPSQTVTATRQLVEQDKVFAIFNALGTEHNVATRSYLNASRVPQLFVASGATTFGRDYERYPWTIGFQPSYRAEGWIYGKYLARSKPGAKVAVLLQNDDYGKELMAGLKQGIARSKVKVVAAQPYEVAATDVQSQIAKLKASGADVLALFATPRFAIQGYVIANRLGWRPLVVSNAVSSASNVMTLASEGGLEQGGRELDLDRLPQGSDRGEVAQRPGDRAVPLGDGPLREGREREGRLPRLRHVGRLRGRPRAEGGREDADARRRDGADAQAHGRVEPFPAPGDCGRDDGHGALPDRAGGAAALVEGELAELRRPLGLPRELTDRAFQPAATPAFAV